MLDTIFSAADKLGTTLQAYPEAPYIIGALTLIFGVSFMLVFRELLGWFIRTSSIQNQNQELQQEIKEIRYTLKQITETLGVDHTRYISKSKVGSNAPKATNFAAAIRTEVESAEPEVLRQPEKIENKIFARLRTDEVEEKTKGKGFPLSH